MRRPNGGVIWLLLSGAMMGFALALILSSMLFLNYLIPIFILLVISGYLSARVIGRAGGEFSDKVKNYSIILEGFVFGMAFDLIRFRYDWLINVFKYIAVGAFFILISVVLKRNLDKFREQYPSEEPQLGLMRPSILYVLAGFCFATTINTVTEAFMGSGYFIASLPLLALFAILLMVFSSPDFDLLSTDSGVWTQLFAGACLGFAYDLALFRVLLWQDLLKLFIVCVIFAITAIVIRMKSPTKLGVGQVSLELSSTKPRKKQEKTSGKKVVGEITLQERKSPKTSTKKKSSSKKR